MPKSKGDPRRTKALTYLREGHVRIIRAHTAEPGDQRAYGIQAHVRGHLALYEIRGVDGVWTCPCRGDDRPMSTISDQCAHAAATALVTGWPSAAGLPAQDNAPAVSAAGASGTPERHHP